MSEGLDRIFPMHGERELGEAEVRTLMRVSYVPVRWTCLHCDGRADHTTAQHEQLFR